MPAPRRRRDGSVQRLCAGASATNPRQLRVADPHELQVLPAWQLRGLSPAALTARRSEPYLAAGLRTAFSISSLSSRNVSATAEPKERAVCLVFVRTSGSRVAVSS